MFFFFCWLAVQTHGARGSAFIILRKRDEMFYFFFGFGNPMADESPVKRDYSPLLLILHFPGIAFSFPGIILLCRVQAGCCHHDSKCLADAQHLAALSSFYN